MHVVVLVKPVPDPDKVRFDPVRGTIVREGVELVLSPYDLAAVEVAVSIKERVGGRVTAIAMAPPHGEPVLREALARGVDRAVLLTDRRFAGADTLATSYTLASAVRKLGGFDIIVCGEKSTDGDTAQVPAEVAEMLGVPHLGFVSRVIEVTERGVVAVMDLGDEELVARAPLPCLLHVTLESARPRRPTVRGRLAARKAVVERWGADALAEVAEPSRFGLAGSPTLVRRVVIPKERERARVVLSVEEGAKKLVEIIRSLGELS